jgi:rhodanese-related sulfurtransferase
VTALFHEPGYATEDVVFIDARASRVYEEGHIPGALRLDHFQPESTLAEVLPVALQARLVVVYCGGGDCEDSEYTALFLQESGLPPDRLRVFSGGMTAWRAARLPVELGTRHSGQLEPQ